MSRLIAACLLPLSLWVSAPAARADTQCPYPGVGVLGVNIGGVNGGFCDFPVEINGSHWHCQGGGVHLGIGFAGSGVGSGGSLGIAQAGQGIGGVSCDWRCPDNTGAPQPNPPGAWQHYLVPMKDTNWCALNGHMDPAGFWSDPVLPTEGIPPAGEPPAIEEQRPQPVPPALPDTPDPQQHPTPAPRPKARP
jgi:hypothetical protein